MSHPGRTPAGKGLDAVLVLVVRVLHAEILRVQMRVLLVPALEGVVLAQGLIAPTLQLVASVQVLIVLALQLGV